MNRSVSVILLFFVLATGWILMATERCFAEPLDELGSRLPPSFGHWKAEEEDRVYDARSIFDYIDGAGEVYRAYGMRKCFSRRYGGPKGAFLVLDIFDMGSSEDAFGISTHDLDGDPVEFGQGGLYKSGWLRFWKGPFFVSIFDETQTSASDEGARVLAKTVSGLIRESGPLPRLVSGLPSSGLDPRSLRYLHDPVILNTHFYLSDENILLLDSRTEAALATYRREGAKVTILLVRYPDAGKAGLAYGSLMKHYLPDADPDGMARLENRRWAGAGLRGRLLGAVLEAEGREPAKDLLREILESGEKP